jgi:hypothetical protein
MPAHALAPSEIAPYASVRQQLEGTTMDEATTRDHIQKHADAVVRGDMDAVTSDFSEELRPRVPQIAWGTQTCPAARIRQLARRIGVHAGRDGLSARPREAPVIRFTRAPADTRSAGRRQTRSIRLPCCEGSRPANGDRVSEPHALEQPRVTPPPSARSPIEPIERVCGTYRRDFLGGLLHEYEAAA